jgi:hypothetical protein
LSGDVDRTVFVFAGNIVPLASHGATEFTSNPPEQYKNVNDDQDSADDAAAAVSAGVTIAVEGSLKPPSRKKTRMITKISPSDMTHLFWSALF